MGNFQFEGEKSSAPRGKSDLSPMEIVLVALKFKVFMERLGLGFKV
jgi:hypothetical protein